MRVDVGHGRAEVEDRVERRASSCARSRRRRGRAPRKSRSSSQARIAFRWTSRYASSRGKPALDEREQQRAGRRRGRASAQRFARHALGVDDEPVDDPGEPVEHVVEREERVGNDDPLGRRVRDVALVPERHVLEPDDRARARTTRARPQIRSATFGLRLCGIADEPFMPGANGSSTSRTSVRARWRISVANRSSDVAPSASATSSSACRSRAITCVETGLGLEAEPLAGDPLDLWVDRGVGADRAGELADAARLERPAQARRGRGRARTPSRRASSRTSSARRGCRAMRPMQIVCRCSSARATTAASARVDALRDQRARVADLKRERGVDDVRGGQAVVDPAPLRRRAAPRRRRRTRRGRGRSSARSRRRARASARGARADRGDVGGRHDAQLGPRVERGQLHLEPARELALLRPDPAIAGRE